MDTSFARLRSTPRSSPRPLLPQAADASFEQFFRDQYPVVVRIAFAVVGDAYVAQDVAQDVFVAALSRFPEPTGTEHAAAWVRVAAAHTALIVSSNTPFVDG